MTDDPVWRRNEIQSPCIRVCVIHPETRLCTGCARSSREITRWSRYSDEERADIMAELPNRTAIPKSRRGGRAGRLSKGKTL